jgi:hypothetical protein
MDLSLMDCEQCGVAKASQKNLKKNWLGSSNMPGEQSKKEVLEEQSSGILLLMTKKIIFGVLR